MKLFSANHHTSWRVPSEAPWLSGSDLQTFQLWDMLGKAAAVHCLWLQCWGSQVDGLLRDPTYPKKTKLMIKKPWPLFIRKTQDAKGYNQTPNEQPSPSLISGQILRTCWKRHHSAFYSIREIFLMCMTHTFLVTMICFGCSSIGSDLMSAATSSAVFHLASWPRRFWPAHTDVWMIFKNNWPVLGLNIKMAPLIGFVVRFPSNVYKIKLVIKRVHPNAKFVEATNHRNHLVDPLHPSLTR